MIVIYNGYKYKDYFFIFKIAPLPMKKNKKERKERQKSNPFLRWRGVFSISISQKRLVRWTIMGPILTLKISCRRFIRNDPLIDPLQFLPLSLSLSRREYSECSKRSLDTSSIAGNWKRNTRLILLLVRFPRWGRKEIIAQFKNRRGCARFLYYAPCPSWQGWKITRPLSHPL